MSVRVYATEGLKSVVVTIAVYLLTYAKDYLEAGNYYVALVLSVAGAVAVFIAYYMNYRLILSLIKRKR